VISEYYGGLTISSTSNKLLVLMHIVSTSHSSVAMTVHCCC